MIEKTLHSKTKKGVWGAVWGDVHLLLILPYPNLADSLSALTGLKFSSEVANYCADIVVDKAPKDGFIITSGLAHFEVSCLADLYLRILSLIGSLLLERTQQIIVHAGAIETRAGALLFSGPSYVGKSTLGFHAWQAGLTLLGDDRLVFCPDSASVSPFPKPLKPRVSSLPLSNDRLDDIHQFWGRLENEAHHVLARSLPRMKQINAQVPVHRIFFLERNGAPNSELFSLTAAEALPRWLNQLMLSRSEGMLRSLSRLEELSHKGRVHLLRVGEHGSHEALQVMLARQ